MDYKILTVFLVVVLVKVTLGQSIERIDFDLNGQSVLHLINKTGDSINIKIENWYLLPTKSQELDTVMAPGSSLKYELIIQGKSYFLLFVQKSKFNVFTRPGSIDTITFTNSFLASQTINFSGDLQEVNEYLQIKSKKFGSINAELLPRVKAFHESELLSHLVEFNDSITQVHLQYLAKNESLLPKWYSNFENKRLKYLNAKSILNSVLYRKFLEKEFKDAIPEGFLERTLHQTPIHDETMLGHPLYIYFLNNYIEYKYQIEFLSTKENEDNDSNQYFGFIDSELSGLVKDVYLSWCISEMIDNKSHLFDERWIERVKDEELRVLLTNYSNSDQVLSPGASLPYFYLPDTLGNYYHSNQFKGQVVLINFWATWCKPCIKEFPYENKLIEKYQGKPVKIINICVESDKDQCKYIIKKYSPKSINLIAQDNWDKKLHKDFDINGLPHSVLVDSNGNVIQNKCERASRNIDEYISSLLTEMKDNQ